MLSRVADSLYWIGCYVERAENVVRLLSVTSELTSEIEGFDELLAQSQWDELIAALPGTHPPTADFSLKAGLSLPYVQSLLLDVTNPMSVHHSLQKARDNARSVREAITREVFMSLNEVFRELGEARRKRLRDPAVGYDLVVRIHRAIIATLGAMENTMSRDEGWTFMKLGEAVERTLRTLFVLRAKLPALQPGTESSDVPLYYARWRTLLRSLASLENYRRDHGAGLEPDLVIRFLLFNQYTPRSVRRGIARMKQYLDILPATAEVTNSDRAVGKLLATITYDDEEIMRKEVPEAFCDRMIGGLLEAHDAILRQYVPL
jgi:uncharacterized alpha-E superfamily protein